MYLKNNNYVEKKHKYEIIGSMSILLYNYGLI